MTRYILAFLATFGLILLLLILLFHGGGKPKTPAGKTLDSYSTSDAVARMTIDGPINADQIHQAIRITVGRDQVTFEQIQGYQGNVVNLQTYPNNNEAYASFLLALAHAGYARGDNSAALKDERGYCPLGKRYVFELTQEDQEIEHYWATSCGKKPATYLGLVSVTIALFKAQVPDYSTLTENLTL